jgi:protein involved in ribonucleotide reduction
VIVYYYSHGGNTSRFVADRLVPEILAAGKENGGLGDRGELWLVRVLSSGPRSPMSNLFGELAGAFTVSDQMLVPNPQLSLGVQQGIPERELKGAMTVWGPQNGKERAIIVVPTYGSLHNGNVPENAMPQAIQDLIEMVGADKFEGVVAMGNRNFGKDFAGAGAVTEIPLLAEIELAGNRHEAKIIAENLFAEKENKNV